MRIFYKYIFFFGGLHLLCFCSISHGQTNHRDSINKIIGSFKNNDTLKVKKLINLSHDIRDIDPDFSFVLADSAISASEIIRYSKGIAYATRQRGLVYYLTSDNLNALKEFQNALKLPYTDTDLSLKGSLFNNIANIYADLEQYDIALENYNEFYRTNVAVDNQIGQVYALINIATINMEQGKIDASINELHDALELSKKIDDEYLKGAAYNNLGIAHKKNKAYKLSIENYTNAIASSKKTQNKYMEATATNGLGKVALLKKEYNNAIEYAQQSLKLSIPINAVEWQSDSWELLYKAHEGLGNETKSLEAYKNYERLQDSIYGKEITANIIREKAEFDTEKQQEIISLNKRKQKYLITSIIIGSTFLLITIIIIFYYNKKRQNAITIATEKQFKTKVSELELKALNAQINPHFLYNALTSIGKYILKNDSESANDYLTKYASLVRRTLENSTKELISLENEIELLKMYLNIEEKRLRNKFEYTINISESLDPKAILIPPLIVQPFIENSIIHGFSTLEKKGSLNIEFSMFKDNLLCIVDDNGIGRKATTVKSNIKKESLGVDITKSRVNLMNDNSNMNIKIIDKEKGTRVEVQLPIIIDD